VQFAIQVGRGYWRAESPTDVQFAIQVGRGYRRAESSSFAWNVGMPVNPISVPPTRTLTPLPDPL